MNRKTALLTVGLIFVLGACSTSRGFDAEPVVSATDPREVSVPGLSDDDALGDQDCFRIEVWVNPVWDTNRGNNRKTMGVACMVEVEEKSPK